MSEIRCRCAACGGQYKVPDKYAGKKIKCPKCGNEFAAVPLDPGKPAAAPATPSQPAPAKSPARWAGAPRPGAVPGPSAGGPAGLSAGSPGPTANPSRAAVVTTGVSRGGSTGATAGRRSKKGSSSPVLLVGGVIAAVLMIAGTVGALVVISGRDHGKETAQNQSKQEETPSENTDAAVDSPVYTPAGGGDFSDDLPRIAPNQGSADSVTGPDDKGAFSDVEIGSEAPDDPVPSTPEPEEPFEGFSGWTQDFAEAQAKAENEHKDLLILFTGSDWCPPCKALHKYVLEGATFQRWAEEKYVCVVLDFANDKSKILDPAQNERLKGQYGVTGFPTVILAKPDGTAYATRTGGTTDPHGFIAWADQARTAGKISHRSREAEESVIRRSF